MEQKQTKHIVYSCRELIVQPKKPEELRQKLKTEVRTRSKSSCYVSWS